MAHSHLLLIGSCVCFFLSAVGVNVGRLNLTALGLFCWTLSLLV